MAEAPTVTVACKLPNGLTIEKDGQSVTLRGANHAAAIAGYGMTHGVDKAMFEAWKADMGEKYAPVTSGAIFAVDKPDKAADMARERERERLGFEGLDPDKPGPDVEPTDEQKKENAKAAANKAGG